MNFRITYLHIIHKKGKKRKQKEREKNSDNNKNSLNNMIKKWLIHTGRHQITPKKYIGFLESTVCITCRNGYTCKIVLLRNRLGI